jgi:serine phosphatase RsbU (regulator of sigma subunit)/uncharacterized membrane protein
MVSRLLLALGLAICFGILNWVCSGLTLPGAAGVALRPQVAIPVTVGLALGPLPGFITGFAGNIIGDFLSGYGLQYWDWSIGNGLFGAIPGILYLKNIRSIRTVGQFGLVLLSILVANLIGLSTGTFTGSLLLHRNLLGEAILEELLPSLLTNVLLTFAIVPLLLLAIRRLVLTLETRVILLVTFLLAACILGTTAVLVSHTNSVLNTVLGNATAGQVVADTTLELLRWAGLASVIILLAGTITSIFVVRRLTSPVSILCTAAEQIGSGDYQTAALRPVIKRGDELGELARTLRNMGESLKTHIQELQEATAARERIESDLRVATDIQMSMLPRVFPPFPERREFDIFAMMQPAKEVGGDLYDFFLIAPDKLCFVIGDVCGKGIPAALFMAIAKTLLKTAGMAGVSPDKMLSQTNETLYAENDSSMFVTAFCAILDTTSGEMTFANAGHPPPLRYDSVNGFQYLKVSEGFVVGPLPEPVFTCDKMTLKPGEVIFLYTDVVTEATDENNRLYSEARLQKALAGASHTDVTATVKWIQKDISDFVQGAPQSDDITMLAVRFLGNQASTTEQKAASPRSTTVEPASRAGEPTRTTF